jgi:hypothetical protein
MAAERFSIPLLRLPAALVASFFMRGRMGGVDRHAELVRSLAYIDQALANAEEGAADPDDECQQSALDFLIEFQAARRNVDAELRGDIG